MGQVKLYAVRMERYPDCIRPDQGQVAFDPLRIELDLRQMKRDVLQVAFGEEQIEPVFPCLVFSRSALFAHPVYMECRESVVAAPHCHFVCNRK